MNQMIKDATVWVFICFIYGIGMGITAVAHEKTWPMPVSGYHAEWDIAHFTVPLFWPISLPLIGGARFAREIVDVLRSP